MSQDTSIREQILLKGIHLTTGDRNATYGDPHHNMQHFASMLTAYFSSVLSYQFSPEDAAVIMALAKLSRIKANPDTPIHLDNYIDGAVYLAMAGESRKRTEAGD